MLSPHQSATARDTSWWFHMVSWRVPVELYIGCGWKHQAPLRGSCCLIAVFPSDPITNQVEHILRLSFSVGQTLPSSQTWIPLWFYIYNYLYIYHYTSYTNIYKEDTKLSGWVFPPPVELVMRGGKSSGADLHWSCSHRKAGQDRDIQGRIETGWWRCYWL